MDINQLRGLANPSTGLVPMIVTRSFAPWLKGARAGFPPETALMHINNGDAALLGAGSGENIPQVRKDGSPREPRAVPPVTKPGDVPDIPADWESRHHLQRLKMAQQILPHEKVPDGVKPLEYADSLIRDELARRAAQ